jgi:hypothetical protein
MGSRERPCRPLWVTQGAACPWDPVAPAKFQNNEIVAAKPKSGAKYLWNAAWSHRPHGTPPQRGLPSAGNKRPQFQGTMNAQCSFPAALLAVVKAAMS